MKISFLLNGEAHEAEASPQTSLLDYLRETCGLTGTKEGCNEGDCGACTVVVGDGEGQLRPLNACILFLPQVAGLSVRTIEGIGTPEAMHPVQAAMVTHHGSQCGFCTPGFIASMVVSHAQGARDHEDRIAGNLCRCTGYAPILRAARAAQGAPAPDWIARDAAALREGALPAPQGVLMPKTSDELAALCETHPDAVLVAGATDIGLWVTKGLRDLGSVIFLRDCADLRGMRAVSSGLWIGAMTPIRDLRDAMETRHPSYAEMLRRYGAEQVRAAATLGGNLANGSPIGDNAPALIALGARLVLRKGAARREIALEDFFLDYGRQDRRAGEFVEGVILPDQEDHLHVFKVSKRFDEDISALCGAFNLIHEGGVITQARVAFGGMAATPKRAPATEAALLGARFDAPSLAHAQAALAEDFTPLSDLRASAQYRIAAAQGLLARIWAQRTGGAATDLRQVQP